MTGYRIVCTFQEPAGAHHQDAHIVKVGTGLEAYLTERIWTVAEVWDAIAAGHTFYTQSASTGARAAVGKWTCRSCGRDTLKSHPDAILDNNLDNLRRC